MKVMRVFLLAVMSIFFCIACKPSHEGQSGLQVSDLSGEYVLNYVGKRSDAQDSNQDGFCGGRYHLVKTGQGQYPSYSLFSSDHADAEALLSLQFQNNPRNPVIIESDGSFDTILGYKAVNLAKYDPEVHSLADSLFLCDNPKWIVTARDSLGNPTDSVYASIQNRTVMAHKDYLLLQTDRGPRGDYFYFRFDR